MCIVCAKASFFLKFPTVFFKYFYSFRLRSAYQLTISAKNKRIFSVETKRSKGISSKPKIDNTVIDDDRRASFRQFHHRSDRVNKRKIR